MCDINLRRRISKMRTPRIVPEYEFEGLLKERLKGKYFRAQKIFRNYGSLLSEHVMNVIYQAYGKSVRVLDLVLKKLEQHWNNYLQGQYSRKEGRLELKPTIELFISIYRYDLGIQIMDPVP